MFCRKWSALPADPVFPKDLKDLGYFINKDDEIRSIENEDNYFKFFINRNFRICDRQRFSFNQAIQAEIHDRLTALGLTKQFLPIGTTDASQPCIPIFLSANIATKTRVVIIFGETDQDLGVLAHRIIGGAGGINKGSMVSIVKALQQQQSSPADPSAPGIILTNMGELLWWPEGRRSLTLPAFVGSPMTSAAHIGNYIDEKLNRVQGNENPAAHVRYILNTVVPTLLHEDARLDIIGLGDGADVVESYLNSNVVWERIGRRISCLAIVGGQFAACDLKCDGLRRFLEERARAYIFSPEPLGTPIAGPAGNTNITLFNALGCPIFSNGEEKHIETLFVASNGIVLEWLQEVALAPGGVYKNPEFVVELEDPDLEFDPWGADWDEGGEGKEDEKGEGKNGEKEEKGKDEEENKEEDNATDAVVVDHDDV